MTSNVILRPAEAGDLDAIAQVFTRANATLLSFLPSLHTPEQDLAFVRNVMMTKHQVTVAEADGQIVGLVALTGDWLDQLQVDPDHLGQGIGTALIQFAQGQQDFIQLWCFQQNQRARALYERHGFEAVQFTDGAGNAEKTPDVRYEWKRSPD